MMVSRYEGFGRTLIEAQSFGVVPIAYNSYSALSWILNNGSDSIIVESFDAEMYAAQMAYLAKNKEIIRKYSSMAHLNSKRFCVTKIEKMWLKLVDENPYV
jgi:glycosyltransferase involved in cell wall biosynthesis